MIIEAVPMGIVSNRNGSSGNRIYIETVSMRTVSDRNGSNGVISN